MSPVRTISVGFLMLLASCAPAPPPPSQVVSPPDIAGTWVGSYRSQSGNTGTSTLVLRRDGASVSGTIQVSNVERSFGGAPRLIQDGRLVGDKLTFSAVGQDGGIFRADFTAKVNAIDGWGRHSGPGYDGQVHFSHRRMTH